jgi:hypothetical protein
MLAVDEGLEATPGVAGDAGQEIAVVGGQLAPGLAGRQPGQACGHVWPRGDLTPERCLPGLLPRRDHDLDGALLDAAAHHLVAELAGLLA